MASPRVAARPDDPRLRYSGYVRRVEVSATRARFDRVYGEHSSSSDVYAGSVAPLIARVAHSHAATILFHGHAGSGKSFTMRHLVDAAAHELFARLGSAELL